MTKTYQEKTDNVMNWVRITNFHWKRLNGNLRNDKDFWNESLHAMTTEDWWDVVEVMKVLEIQEPDAFQKYPYAANSIEDISKKLHFGKTIVKRNAEGRNFDAFRALMNVKDVINYVAGTPTIEFKKPKRKPDPPHIKKIPETTFHNLFTIERP